MFGKPYSHGITRKVIIAFGQLFSDIKLQRINAQTGLIEQLIDVPVSYGNREKWLQRLKEEKNLDQRVLITLPRIGFEIVGFKYDSSRKLNKFNQYRACATDENGNVLTTYTPVPYIIEFAVYIMTKTTDDMLGIVEQIIPYFSPQYNLSINVLPEIGMVQDVPMTLQSVNLNDQMEGPMENRREVLGTLTFSAKIEYVGPIIGGDGSNDIITSVKTKIDPMWGEFAREVDVVATGTQENYTIEEIFFDIPRPIGDHTFE